MAWEILGGLGRIKFGDGAKGDVIPCSLSSDLPFSLRELLSAVWRSVVVLGELQVTSGRIEIHQMKFL